MKSNVIRTVLGLLLLFGAAASGYFLGIRYKDGTIQDAAVHNRRFADVIKDGNSIRPFVVFEDDNSTIPRVIGGLRQNDRIEFIAGMVYLNGKPLKPVRFKIRPVPLKTQ